MTIKTVNNRSRGMDDFIVKLSRRGFKRIGNGCYATVYGKKSSKFVYKVGYDLYDAYLNYVKAIGLNSTNPLFPKIKWAKVFHTDYDSFYVVKIERLVSIDKISGHVYDKLLARLGLKGIWELEYNNRLPQIKKKAKAAGNQHLVTAVGILGRLFKRHLPDLHNKNIMYRKRGRGFQLVITDPIA